VIESFIRDHPDSRGGTNAVLVKNNFGRQKNYFAETCGSRKLRKRKFNAT
jgi:hypothetical protein